ncbi:hypothetical protein SKAU_G00193210 [Synaphobranchus kaupii]|uniref:Uncharacterized protein n=1 Tax=Synaphobranchus kaupii TaxID=118154 RepID=A0A9Q1IVE7_SYNKA|nr:hypothetical protein SKAU_G00193210 [Synaphobranchus kaupii]
MRSPMDRIIKRHPEKKKQIRKYMEKWNKRTTGGQQWPKEGTFDSTCCDEMEAVIKHHKPNDKSDKQEGGDYRRELGLLVQQDRRRRDEEARRAENNRLCTLALQEEEEECERLSREWGQKWDEPLTQEEKESQRQYAQAEEKHRKGRKPRAAKSSGWQHLTSTPAERGVQTLPEGMDNQEKRVRGRSCSPIQSLNHGHADRRPKQRQERVTRPSEGGPKRSQLLFSADETAASMEGCLSGSESGREEEPAPTPVTGHKNRDVHSGRLERTYASRLETKLSK